MKAKYLKILNSTVILSGMNIWFLIATTALSQDYIIKNVRSAPDTKCERFGYSVDISGDFAVVGDWHYNNEHGAVFFYRYNHQNEKWELEASFTDFENMAGCAVAIDRNVAVVGEMGNDDNWWGTGSNDRLRNVGIVHIFKYDNYTGWIKKTFFFPWSNYSVIDANFGHSVDIDGNYIIVGAPGSGNGSAHIFKDPSGNWDNMFYSTQEILLPPTTGDLGWSVAIHGHESSQAGQPDYTAVVGDRSTNKAYVFQSEDVNGNVYPIAQLKTKVADQKWFGQSVDIIGDTILVSGNHGYLYIKPPTGWSGDVFEKYKFEIGDEVKDVAIEDNIVLLGAAYTDYGGITDLGQVHAFVNKSDRWDDPNLDPAEYILRPDEPEQNAMKFGYSVAIDQKRIVIGTPEANPYGSAYLVSLKPRPPENIEATDESFTDRIKVEWNHNQFPTSNEESYIRATRFNIYRDGNLQSSLSTADTYYSWEDDVSNRGSVHTYSVSAVNAFAETDAGYDVGRTSANGFIKGKIYAGSAGVPDILTSINPLGDALYFDGSTDYAFIDNLANLPSNAITVEAWVKPEIPYNIKSDIISVGNSVELRAGTGSEKKFNFSVMIGGVPYTVFDSDIWQSGFWYHVTGVYSNGMLGLYVNGTLKNSINVNGQIDAGGTIITIGWKVSLDYVDHYKGYIDEVRIWEVARDESGLKRDMKRLLDGKESGLFGYWRLDAGLGSGIYDYKYYIPPGTKKMGYISDLSMWAGMSAPLVQGDYTNKNGDYEINNICYAGIGTEFTVTPDTAGGHTFDPESTAVKLDKDFFAEEPINFEDLSQFSVVGRIIFENTDYGIDGVDIIDKNGTLLYTTDITGSFSIAFQAGQHKIIPSFYNHCFVPADTNILVTQNISGLVFKDTTHYILRGKVAAGKDRFDIGEASLIINGPDNCFEKRITTVSGDYEIRLPALQNISVSIDSINGEPLSEFLLDHSGDIQAEKTVSLVKGDTTLDFIYYAKPQVVIKGFPDPTTVYNVPVLDYLDYEYIKFEITEDYGANRISLADSGSINIINDITDETGLTDIALDGREEYLLIFRIGPPNIIPGGSHPYQKRFYARVKTGGGELDTSIWVIVTGYRPREQTFATVSPAIPLLILHDPPGDHSYSYLEESESISFTTSWSMLDDKSQNDYKTLKVGNAFSAGAGFVTQETAVWLMKDKQVNVGSSALNQNEQQFTVTTLERYQTSADETDIGVDSDVFIGVAFNIIYALADILEINDVGEVELSKSIIYGVNNEDAFETTYIYTKKHIEDILLPRYKENLSAETDFDRIQYWKDQIEAWQQIIVYNDSLKLNANEPFGGQTSISISGGIEKYYSTTLEQTESRTIEFNSYIDTDVAREAGLEIGGSGYKQGVQIRSRLNIGKSVRADTTRKQTIGYCIYDDESADNFWIEIKGDPVYGTPVFDLQEGSYTSWPWEQGTVPHEKCLLDMAGDYIQSDIDPVADAVFTLELTNISPSGRSSSYKLFDIPTSNPDGAEMSLYGFSINDVSPFQLEAYQTASVPLKVKRGPYAYDYDDMQLKLRSLNDEQIADTVTFSVHYTAPCSPIRIHEPEESWVVSKNNNDSLRLVLSDYDKSKMTTVMIQYRPKNKTTWENASQFQAGTFPDNNAVIYWNTKGLPEGTYDLRTRVNWNEATGYTYSNKVNGLIDRLPPEIFGKPEPADGVLRGGGQISITFNEDIDKNTAIPDNVTMTNIQNGNKIPVSVTSNERKIIIIPQIDEKVIENQTLQVTLLGVGDVYGNVLEEAIVWSFSVNNNPVYWTSTCITKTSLEGETTTFWLKIKNESSQNITFNIKNIPNWLDVDPLSGSIIQGADRIINFTVNPDINAGYYCDTLFAETPKGDEPLVIILEIQNKPPEWYVNPTAFANSMTITAGFYIDDVPFSEENDLVAAFVGNYLRGVVKVQRIVPQDEYVAFLTVYSNQSVGENVSFRIWDASEGIELDIAESYAFVADTSFGTASLPDSLHVADAMLQSIPLAQDWTWFSLGVEAKNMSTKSILEKLRARNGDLIKGHTEYSQYLPGTGWVGMLDTLDIGAGFKIRLTESRTLEFIGTPVPVADRPIVIDPGWNWIGYLPEEMLSINDALASLATTATAGDLIKNKYAYATYSNSRWQGILELMIPGEGYMFKSENGGTLTYPGSAGKMINKSTMMSAKAIFNSAPDWQVDAAAFEYSMNVTSALTIDGLPVVHGNTILAAFIQNECRAVSKPVFVKDKWIFFSTVFSNKAEDDSMQFKIYDASNDQIRDVDRKVEYVSDKVIGTPAAPLVLWVGIPTGLEEESEIPKEFALEQNYPNPFNPITTIRYALKQQEDVKLVIYDMLGKKVKVLVDEPQKAGWYDMQFNAKELASGIYIYRIQAGKFEKSHKMVVIK